MTHVNIVSLVFPFLFFWLSTRCREFPCEVGWGYKERHDATQVVTTPAKLVDSARASRSKKRRHDATWCPANTAKLVVLRLNRNKLVNLSRNSFRIGTLNCMCNDVRLAEPYKETVQPPLRIGTLNCMRLQQRTSRGALEIDRPIPLRKKRLKWRT